jgi:hypothetical protein
MTRLSPAMVGVTPRLKEFVGTKADTESSMTQANIEAKKREKWRLIINNTLSIWCADPQSISDDGIEPLQPAAIAAAIEIAKNLGRQGWDAPISVVPDPNGGIVFNFKRDSGSEAIHIWDDGTFEHNIFDGSSLTRYVVN